MYLKGTFFKRRSHKLHPSLKLSFFLLLMSQFMATQADTYPLSDNELATRIANKQQITDVPTIYIDIPEITNESELNSKLKKIRKNNADDEEIAPYFNATITVVDNSPVGSVQHLESFTDEVEIKVRGNSTSDLAKKPYRLKFASKSTSSDGMSHKHDLLGLGYSKRNWTLLANTLDHSMIRNAITYHLGKYVGMDFCPGYKFVDLDISGMYRGTYQVSDHVEVGSNRVNINEDTDWMLEFEDWASMAEAPYVAANNGISYTSIKSPDADDLTSDQISQLISDVSAWRTEWFNAFKSSDPVNGWQAYNDVESMINFYIATEISGDYDGFFVYKGYRTADGPFFWGPLWDKDYAYSNCSYAPDYASNEHKLVEFYGKASLEWIFRNDWMGQVLLADKTFLKKAKAKIDLLIENNLADRLCNDIDNIVGTIQNTVKQNYSKWDLHTTYQLETHSDYSYEQHISLIKGYLRSRLSFIQQELQKYIDALPAPEAYTYNPQKYTWDNGIWTGKSYNVNITNRTLTGGQWNSFSIPFTCSQEQMETALGCTYELLVHTGVDTDGTMVFSAPTSKDITGGVPYLIRPASDVNSFGVLNDVLASYDMNYGQNNGFSVTFDNIHYFNATLFCSDNSNNLNQDFIFDNDLYTDETSLQHMSVNKVTGSRTYIHITDGSTAKIRIADGEGQTPEHPQLTDLPTIYIDTAEGATIEPSSGAWKQAAIEVVDANGTLTPFAEESSHMRIRGRGTTTWTATQKKSYRIQFSKDVVDGLGIIRESHRHNLLSPETTDEVKQRNWVLMANAGDKSLVRNALTKHLGDGVGLDFTPGYCFVDLVLNGTYVGTYQVTDYIEPGANRVNVDVENGWLVEMMTSDKVDDTDHIIDGDANTPFITVKSPEIDNDRETFNATFKAFFDPMWEANDGTGMDATSLINWYIATEILGNYEALADIYAYKEADGDALHFGPLWSNDLSFDNCEQQDMSSNGLMGDLSDTSSFEGLVFYSNRNSCWKTKLATLWEQEWFSSAVINRWHELYKGGNNDLHAALLNALSTLEQQLAQSQAKNFSPTALGGAGWSLSGQGLTGHSSTRDFESHAEAVEQVRTYLDERFQYLDCKFNALASTGDTFPMGDVNHDGSIGVSDVMLVVNYILGYETGENFHVENANVNEDGTVNVADVMAIVNIVLDLY